MHNRHKFVYYYYMNSITQNHKQNNHNKTSNDKNNNNSDEYKTSNDKNNNNSDEYKTSNDKNNNNSDEYKIIKIDRHTDLITLTLNKVSEIAKKDNILTNTEITNTIAVIKTIFASKKYLNKIKNDIYEIVCENIGLHDIPAIIHLILDSKKFIFALLDSNIKVSQKMMKYIIFSILYYIIIEDGKITEFENKVLETFEYTWKLLSYNPLQISSINITEISCTNFLKKLFYMQ